MSAKTYTKQLLKQNQGVAMIEFALILPVLVLITFGAIEYGMYFLKSNMNNNNVAAAARAVQADPGDPSNRELLTQTSLINNQDNKACANSFASLEAAKTANCPAGLWNTLPPKDLPKGQTAYFVLIESNVVSKSLSGLFDEGSALDVVMPTNVARQVIKVGSVQQQEFYCDGVPLTDVIGMCTSVIACSQYTSGNNGNEDYEQLYKVNWSPIVCSSSNLKNKPLWKCDLSRAVTRNCSSQAERLL